MAAAGVSAHRGQLVKAGEQFIQRHDQLLGRALRSQAGEAFNVRKQYAAWGWGGREKVKVSKTDKKDKRE